MNTREVATQYRLSHWAGIMRDRQESGLSIRAYCEKAGFHENRYYYWQKRLREEACTKLASVSASEEQVASQGFTQVQLIDKAQSSKTSGSGQLSVEISGMRITSDGEYPSDKLLAILRELSLS